MTPLPRISRPVRLCSLLLSLGIISPFRYLLAAELKPAIEGQREGIYQVVYSATSLDRSLQLSNEEEGSPRPIRPMEGNRVGLLFGWPRSITDPVLISGRSPTVVDIDRNRDWELGIVSGNGRLYLYQHDGAYFPGFPSSVHRGGRARDWEDVSHRSLLASGYWDSGDRPILTYITDIGFLHLFDEWGDEPRPFPLDVGRFYRWGGFLTLDLTGDQTDEIIFTGYLNHPDSASGLAFLGVIDSHGQYLDGFPIVFSHQFISAPTVGELNGEDPPEIIVALAQRDTFLCRIDAYNNRGERVAGFPRGGFMSVGNQLTTADRDGDGLDEIYFWGRDTANGRSGIWGIDHRGRILNGFPWETRKGHPQGEVAIADVEGDGSLDFAFGTYDPPYGAQIYLWNAQGRLQQGFPIELNRPCVIGSVLMEDISGDRVLDLVVGVAPEGRVSGAIEAYDRSGHQVEGFPISLISWGEWSLGGSPTLHDLNRDGNTDLMAISSRGTLYVWATAGAFTGRGWLTERGSFSRQGRLHRPREVLSSQPNQNLPIHSQLFFYPQPFNSQGIITLNTLHNQMITLKMSDLLGREVFSIYQGPLCEGIHRFSLNLADRSLPAGTYYLISNIAPPQPIIYLP